jgi:hypothetical protein
MAVETIDDLLELVAAGDEEAGGRLKAMLGSKDREAAILKRDIRLKTDATLRERYPRALRAYDKGKLKLTDDMDDNSLVDLLKEVESDYAEMGVPVEAHTAASGTPVEPVVVASDPALALSGGRAAGSPGGSPRDLVAEYFDAAKGSTVHDQARANNILVELNQTRQRDKIDQITRSLEARPITLNNI